MRLEQVLIPALCNAVEVLGHRLFSDVDWGKSLPRTAAAPATAAALLRAMAGAASRMGHASATMLERTTLVLLLVVKSQRC